MSILWTSLFLTLFGSLGARQENIDINRLHRVEGANEQANNGATSEEFHYRRSFLDTNRIYGSNDYDDHSSWLAQPRSPVHFRYPAPPFTDAQAPVKIYQPREDPRLFYQSDEYLKEINGKNVNYEVASIYPGREVVRVGEEDVLRTLPAHRLRSRENNQINFAELKHCVKCPRDRTLIAKPGSDRVILQIPRLLSCTGRKASKHIRFVQMYGPKFGSLLQEGSYSIVGRMMNWNENLQICRFKVHVVIQSCRTPKSLVAQCKGHDEPCNFTCRDTKFEIHGTPSLRCGDDLQWEGNLPTCRARNYCMSQSPPEHGRISCKGNPAGAALQGLAEGSRCRVRCAQGWRANPRATAVCRRGVWTYTLTCQPKNGIQTE